jgi:hypothetical protein
MSISRREFLGGAAMAAALPYLNVLSFDGSRTECHCTLLDLRRECALRESFGGYLAEVPSSAPRAPVLIVPAALSIPTRDVEVYLLTGGTVILESGAAFGDSAAFEAQRQTLGKMFAITIDKPVELWPRRTPYVHYTWPLPVMVRDFSRILPITAANGEIIATADGLPVAIRQSIAAGTLIFLGSPLGPALWAGDAEAKRWLEAACGTWRQGRGMR